MQRRRVLQVLGSLTALPFMGVASVESLEDIGRRVHASLTPGATPRALSEAQLAIVTDAAERIIPRTDTPGATDARVADFVDTMLADWYDAPDRDRFLAGVDALDRRAVMTCATGFARCTAAQQTSLLDEHDAAVAELRASDPHAADAHWFAMLKFLTVWGYYTSRAAFERELHEQFLPGYFNGAAPYARGGETSGG